MESTKQKHQGRCQDTVTERSPNLTIINHLPDEILVEIFDFYRRRIIDKYYHEWRTNYLWFDLAHVCRRWRAVIFASSSRLDINIVVRPEISGQIKTILSGHVPIFIDYSREFGGKDMTGIGSALWRMHAALGHRDRVREISIRFGRDDGIFETFIKATTDYHFPALESLDLSFPHFFDDRDIPATFLRGPDRTDLPLRRLRLFGGSLASITGLLSSAKALTDLTLSVVTNPAVSDPLQGSFLLSCLRSAQCLRSLDLNTSTDFRDFLFEDSIATPRDIVPLLQLTRFHYSGPNPFLNDLMSGLSAPSLQDVHFVLRNKSPLFHLSRVIDDVREEFRSVSVTFNIGDFHLLSSIHSEEIDHFKPSSSFKLNVNCSPYSINSMSSTPSTKLAMAEELTLNFTGSDISLRNMEARDIFSMREFLRQFHSVKLLRVNPFVPDVGHYLKQQDDGEATILPVLEQIELSISPPRSYAERHDCSIDEAYQCREAEAMAAFEPCERAGRPVRVYYCKQTNTQSKNARRW